MIEGGNSIHHHLWRLRYTELNEIYATMTLRSLGGTLISIFVPLFLITHGYSLRDIFALNLMMYSVEFLLEYPCAVLIRKYGPKHLIAFSIPFLILHFLLLMSLFTLHWPLWTISLSGGITLALFWQAYHYDFSRTKHRKKTSSEISKLYIALALMGAIAPFIGGFIAVHFGMYALYAVAVFILCLAPLPLLKTGERHRLDRKISLRKIDLSKIRFDIISYMGNGVEVAVVAVIWPVFIYYIVKNYQSVGLVTSLALLITVLVTYLVGKRADKRNRRNYIKVGGFLNGLIFILQTLAYTVFHVFFFNLARSFATSYYSAPYTSEYYLHADEYSRSEYMFYMESAVDLGRAMLFLALYLMTFFLGNRQILLTGLVLGALGAFLITLMPRANCEICGPMGSKRLRLQPRPARK